MAVPPTLQKPKRTWLYVLFLIVAVCVAVPIVVWFQKSTQVENNLPTALLSEDFTGESLASLEAQGWSAWYKTQMPEVLDNYQWSLSQGAVSVENGALKATGVGGFIYSANWSDYIMAFKFKTNASPSRFWCGLAFRADSTWTSESWPQNSYILQLGYFGSTNNLWKVVNGAWSKIASSDNFELNVNPGLSNLWHDVRLEAQGSSLKVYVDNQSLLSVADGSLTSGSVGLLSCNATVYFDDLTVS